MAKKEIKLSPEDQVAIIGNLGLFHGDWELYVRWLKGYPKDSPRYNDIPRARPLQKEIRKKTFNEAFCLIRLNHCCWDSMLRS